MKCIPQTCAGRFVAAARRPIGIDDVLDASTARGVERRVELPEERQLELHVLAGGLDRQLGIRRAARSVEVAMRASTASGSSHWPFAASLASDAAMPARPRSSCSSPTSTSVTCMPALAATWAMPAPIWPAPTTRTRSITRPATSITIASPCPPPEQIAARPRPPPRAAELAARACRRSRAPEAPTGWPSATAPPLTLTRSGSTPRSRVDCSATDANASLISITSMSAAVEPGALERDLRGLGAGTRASESCRLAVQPVARMRASGSRLRSAPARRRPRRASRRRR